MITVHYLSSSWVPSREANSVQVMKMCEALAARVSVTAFTADGPIAGVVDTDFYGVANTFSIVKLPRPRIRWIGALIFNVALAARLRAFPKPALYYGRYAPALWAVRRFGVPIIYEAHTMPRSPTQATLERRLIRHESFRGLVVISDALRQGYSSLCPELGDRVLIAPDAAADPMAGRLDYPRFVANLQNDKRPRVGYIGSLSPGKGVEVIGPLATAAPDLSFEVIGGDPETVASCRRQYSAANLRFRGYVAHGDLAAAYSRFDYLLAPYQKEVYGAGGTTEISRWMSPLKLFEYMAAARPIVCSDLPVLREVMEHERNCLMVPPDDVAAWAKALRTLQSNPELAARIAAAARSDFEKNYTWRRRADHILDFAGVL